MKTYYLWRKGKLKTTEADPQAKTTRVHLAERHFFETEVDAWRDRLSWLRRSVRNTKAQATMAEQRLRRAIEDCPHKELAIQVKP